MRCKCKYMQISMCSVQYFCLVLTNIEIYQQILVNHLYTMFNKNPLISSRDWCKQFHLREKQRGWTLWGTLFFVLRRVSEKTDVPLLNFSLMPFSCFYTVLQLSASTSLALFACCSFTTTSLYEGLPRRFLFATTLSFSFLLWEHLLFTVSYSCDSYLTCRDLPCLLCALPRFRRDFQLVRPCKELEIWKFCVPFALPLHVHPYSAPVGAET